MSGLRKIDVRNAFFRCPIWSKSVAPVGSFLLFQFVHFWSRLLLIHTWRLPVVVVPVCRFALSHLAVFCCPNLAFSVVPFWRFPLSHFGVFRCPSLAFSVVPVWRFPMSSFVTFAFLGHAFSRNWGTRFAKLGHTVREIGAHGFGGCCYYLLAIRFAGFSQGPLMQRTIPKKLCN